jgi:hypothetical protein
VFPGGALNSLCRPATRWTSVPQIRAHVAMPGAVRQVCGSHDDWRAAAGAYICYLRQGGGQNTPDRGIKIAPVVSYVSDGTIYISPRPRVRIGNSGGRSQHGSAASRWFGQSPTVMLGQSMTSAHRQTQQGQLEKLYRVPYKLPYASRRRPLPVAIPAAEGVGPTERLESSALLVCPLVVIQLCQTPFSPEESEDRDTRTGWGARSCAVR